MNNFKDIDDIDQLMNDLEEVERWEAYYMRFVSGMRKIYEGSDSHRIQIRRKGD